jgi:hypothetical protein
MMLRMTASRVHGAQSSRVRLWLTVVAIGLLGVTGCSAGNSGTPVPAPSPSAAPAVPAPSVPLAAAYHSPDGYSISPPDGWVLHPTNGQNGVSVVFAASALDPAAKKAFVDNLNVVITATPETLDALVAQTKQQYPSVLTNYKIVTDQPTTLNGHAAHLLGGTYDDPAAGPLQNIQLILADAGKEYTVTFTSAAPSFDGFHEPIQASLSTFTLG